MIETVRKLWSFRVAGRPSRLRRQVGLCNQVGLFSIVITIPYQLFYYFYDLEAYRGVFFANFVFMAVYFSVLLFNHRQRHNTASTLLLVNCSIQLFVVTAFISTDAGVNLFYFTLASILIFLYQPLRIGLYAAGMVSIGLLYLTTYFLFSPDRVSAPVPSLWADIMYVGTLVAVLTLSGAPLFLFRQAIDHAEEELTRKNQSLEILSNTDPLTGLANRRVLDRALQQAWSCRSRHSTALAIIMFDVDCFKRFNDRYGHVNGDSCLQQITEASRSVLSRSSDVIVRYGGEEFALLLPDTDEKAARFLAEKLRETIEHLHIPNEALGKGAHVTISVGVSSLEGYGHSDAHGVEHLLKRADQALYQAKANGRNQVVYLAYDRPDNEQQTSRIS